MGNILAQSPVMTRQAEGNRKAQCPKRGGCITVSEEILEPSAMGK